MTPVLLAATSTCRCFLQKHAKLIRQYVDGAGPIKTRDYSLTSDTDDGTNAEVYFKRNELANENFHRLKELNRKKTASQQSDKDVRTTVSVVLTRIVLVLTSAYVSERICFKACLCKFILFAGSFKRGHDAKMRRGDAAERLRTRWKSLGSGCRNSICFAAGCVA